MASRLTVVLSQGQSNNPSKRQLEETLVAEMLMAPGIDAMVIPHLYDLTPDSSALVALQGLQSDFVLLSWLFARAAHWILDRNHIRGRFGETALKSAWDQRKRKWEKATKEYRPDPSVPRVLDERPVPDRTIYHIDLRLEDDPQIFLKELYRLADEKRTNVVSLGSLPATPSLSGQPTASSDPTAPSHNAHPQKVPSAGATSEAETNGSKPSRRWYPVIDYSRCTNCMECIDFCLFGVYGIDQQETILVEQPDNCRKGCPACSRVCPENAIIFPQHKTPSIAGDPSIGSEMKLDLSQLFGKPSELDTAARERDEALRMAGRTPLTAPVPSAEASDTKDELDALIDELDQLDL